MSKIIRTPSNVERSAPDGFVTRRSLNTSSILNSLLPSKLQAVVDEASKLSTVFKTYPDITSLEQLELLLAQLIIRFDTKPDFYTKKDYQLLISILSGCLSHLYKIEIKSDNEDVLQVENLETGAILKPQIGSLKEEGDEDENGTYIGPIENNERKIATIGDIRNYINNKLTWIKYE